MGQAEYESLLEDFINGRYLAVASFTAFLYDFCLTFPEEVKYFWRGRGTLQFILFLANRYIPFVISPLTLTVFFATNLSVSFCNDTIEIVTVVFLFQSIIAQGILVIRVYFMYTFSRILQITIIACYAIDVALCTLFTTFSLQVLRHGELYLTHDKELVMQKFAGCQVPRDWDIWKTFITAFAFHVVLFVFTTARVFREQTLPGLDDEMRSILRRLIQDGGFWYILILLSVGWTGIGSTLSYRAPSTAVPAMYSGFMQNMISISISRVMLSIRSLAASLTFDPPWALNTSELARLHLRSGRVCRRRGNDVLVELAASDPLPFSQTTGLMQEPTITVSRTGVVEDYYIGGSVDGHTEESYRYGTEESFDPSSEVVVQYR